MEGHSKTAPRAGERWHDKHDQFFLNFRTTNVQNHRARLLHGMRNRRSLSESHFGGTFLLTLIYDTRSESMDFEDFTMAEKQTRFSRLKSWTRNARSYWKARRLTRSRGPRKR